MALMGSGLALSVTSGDAQGEDQGFSASGTVTYHDAVPPTLAVAGGVTPYTYSWAWVNTVSGNTPSITGATTGNPTWSATVNEVTPSVSNWTLTVTDAVGTIAQGTLNLTLLWTNLGA